MKYNSKEDNPENSRMGIQHRSTDCHSIEDRVETKAPDGGLIGMSVIDLFSATALVVVAFVIMVAFVVMLVVAFMFMVMVTFSFTMLMLTMAVTVTAHPMSQCINHHHKRETTGNTNTN